MKADIIIAVIAVLMLVLSVPAIQKNAGTDRQIIENMNRQELHYDANGYFIMVSVTDELVGVYDSNKPIKHYRCNFTKKMQLVRPVVITVEELEAEGIVLNNVDLYEQVPAGTPVLIYERKVEK